MSSGVSGTSSKIVVYVLCYDAVSELQAQRAFGHFGWARVVHIPTTMFLESVMYWLVLDQRREEWAGSDFVGTLSYCADQKIDVPDMEALCSTAAAEGRDVVALHASDERMLLQQACRSHPRFPEVWVPLLRELGYTEADAIDDGIPAFYCNFWLARPEWMQRYIAFFKRAKAALEGGLDRVQDALWSDSGYPGRLRGRRCNAIWGRPYYPHHCFVAERLPCFFFWKEGASVRLVRPEPRAQWSRRTRRAAAHHDSAASPSGTSSDHHAPGGSDEVSQSEYSRTSSARAKPERSAPRTADARRTFLMNMTSRGCTSVPK
jgi:hypothetical protein